MSSKLLSKRAMEYTTDCKECDTQNCVCEAHNPHVKELNIPKKKGTSKDYETNKTYQDKGPDTELQVDVTAAGPSAAKLILNYIKSKRVLLDQLLEKRGENVVVGKVTKDLQDTVPGLASVNTSALAGVILKSLIQAEAVKEGRKVKAPFNDSQFLQEIEPILERKKASMREEIFCPNCDSEAAQNKPGYVSCVECGYDGPADFYGAANPKTKMKNQKASSKLAASGGAEDPNEVEEEEEPETSIDSSVVTLLDSCKNEWTNLGEPVNPATWPKEIERAILDLNESVTKAIDSAQGKLIEGEYYIKNVDEGVDAGGGSEVPGMSDLDLAPAEPGLGDAPKLEMKEEIKAKKSGLNDEKPTKVNQPAVTGHGFDAAKAYGKSQSESRKNPSPSLSEMDGDRDSSRYGSKQASVDVTSYDTKKAIKFVEDLQEKVADIFFEYKKVVEAANNSALVKSAGEDMVRLKSKLSEVEKVLGKQFTVLETGEQAIEEAGKKKASNQKRAFPEPSNSKSHPDAAFLPDFVTEWLYTPSKNPAPGSVDKAVLWLREFFGLSLEEDNGKKASNQKRALQEYYINSKDGKWFVMHIHNGVQGEYGTREEAAQKANELSGWKESKKKEVPESIKKKQEEAKDKEKKRTSIFGGLSLVTPE